MQEKGREVFLQTTPAPPLEKEGRSYYDGDKKENGKEGETGRRRDGKTGRRRDGKTGRRKTGRQKRGEEEMGRRRNGETETEDGKTETGRGRYEKKRAPIRSTLRMKDNIKSRVILIRE